MEHIPGPWEAWIETLAEVGPPMRRCAALLDQAGQELTEAIHDYEATKALFKRDIDAYWPGTILPDIAQAPALLAQRDVLAAALRAWQALDANHGASLNIIARSHGFKKILDSVREQAEAAVLAAAQERIPL